MLQKYHKNRRIGKSQEETDLRQVLPLKKQHGHEINRSVTIGWDRIK